MKSEATLRTKHSGSLQRTQNNRKGALQTSTDARVSERAMRCQTYRSDAARPARRGVVVVGPLPFCAAFALGLVRVRELPVVARVAYQAAATKRSGSFRTQERRGAESPQHGD